MSESNIDQATIITSLFIEAVRQGHASWFRVASKSMLPLLRPGDEVYIQPAQAQEIGIGEIADEINYRADALPW